MLLPIGQNISFYICQIQIYFAISDRIEFDLGSLFTIASTRLGSPCQGNSVLLLVECLIRNEVTPCYSQPSRFQATTVYARNNHGLLKSIMSYCDYIWLGTVGIYNRQAFFLSCLQCNTFH